MKWTGFGGKSGVKGGIFAGKIDFAKDGGGGNLFRISGWNRLFGGQKLKRNGDGEGGNS